VRAPGLLLLLLLLAACSGPGRIEPDDRPDYGPVPHRTGVYKLGEPYVVDGRLYVPRFDPHYEEEGIASWYGPTFHGQETANGEIFDARQLTAAHTTLPLPSLVEVTNLENGRRLVLRVNDRGPFVPGRIIDVSDAAARALGFREQGTARVRVRFLRLADARGTPPAPTASNSPEPNPPAQTAALVRPNPSLAEPSAPGTGVCAPTVFVQVGAFADPARAHHHATRLSWLGPARIEWVDTQVGRLGRVQVAVRPGAERELLRRLLDMGYGEAHLVRRSASCVRADDRMESVGRRS